MISEAHASTLRPLEPLNLIPFKNHVMVRETTLLSSKQRLAYSHVHGLEQLCLSMLPAACAWVIFRRIQRASEATPAQSNPAKSSPFSLNLPLLTTPFPLPFLVHAVSQETLGLL